MFKTISEITIIDNGVSLMLNNKKTVDHIHATKNKIESVSVILTAIRYSISSNHFS